MPETSRLNHIFYVLFSLIICTITFLPSIRVRFGLVEIAVLTAVYSACFFSSSLLPYIKKIAIPIIIYGVICFFFGFPFQFKLGFLHPIMTLWIWIFPFLMCTCLIQRNNKWNTRIILWYLLILFGIVLFATVKAMDTFPNVMRMMTSGATDSILKSKLNAMNVGGYGIAYGCGAIFLALVSYILIFKLKKTYFIFSLTLNLFCLYIVIKAQFTTLLGLCVLWTILILFINIKSQFIRISILILGLLTLLVAEPILHSIIEFYQDTKTGEHLQDIYNSIFQDEQYTSLRSEYQINALKVWLQSPLFGNDLTIPQNAIAAIHSHSTLLAIGVKSGLIGIICYYSCYYFAFISILNEINNSIIKKIFIPIGGYFLCLSALNPTESDILNYCLGLLAPLLVFTLYYNSNKNGSFTFMEE